MKEDDFWTWFKKDLTLIESFTPGDEEILDLILHNLHRYNENLFFELGDMQKNKELVITAEGNIEHFDSVERLVNCAPELKDWTFTAFKPPLGFDFITCYEGVDYDPAQLWFLPLVNPNKPNDLALRVGVPKYCKSMHEHSVAALWIVLDTGLGEKAATEQIRFIETTTLPEAPEDEGYIELKELAEYLAWRRKTIH
ncbi:hypothetical protein TDB9533_02449 [Thalassocella blandensis]|nr:hypothetical protein TDB9533_02449 [Thalassocella blandensis]